MIKKLPIAQQFFYPFIFNILFFHITDLNAQDQSCVFHENGGLLLIEAEDLAINSSWKTGNESEFSGYSANGYIVWDGPDYFSSARNGIITTNIQVGTTGTYTFHWRNRVGKGHESTEHNDTWLRFPDASEFYAEQGDDRLYPHGSGKNPNPEGSGDNGFFKVFLTGTLDWTWSSVTSDHQGYTIKVRFDHPGTYQMQLAARSAHHLIDKIALYLDPTTTNSTLDHTGAMQCEDLIYECSESYTLRALNDFSLNQVEGYRPAIVDDANGALAIDATLYKNEFSAVQTIFNGVSAVYNLQLHTLTEVDGESTYQLYINGNLSGTFQNPTSETDFLPTGTVFEELAVQKGDTLRVAFNSHTNGNIPEGDTTAYSRGRWTHLVIECATNGSSESPYGVKTSGEIKRWHNATLSFEGPESSELASQNPFTNYMLQVTFLHDDGTSYVVPGYYAACLEPGETGCNQGNIWKAHFSPDRTGSWNWTATFLEGVDAAITGSGEINHTIHGKSGVLNVIESDKRGSDFRNPDLGRLRYVNEHYLRHCGTSPDTPNGKWFIKTGADATENTLDYEGFDATPNRKNLRKTWKPHIKDFNYVDALSYNWKNGKGNGILGMLRYLSEEGMNVFSFLTFNLGGDDQNVFPYLLKVSETTFESYTDPAQASDKEAVRRKHWNDGVYHDRFDVSKLAQWEKVFAYADKRGLFLHFKLQEEENETLLDNGNTERERKLYYRELVARFGHHLALNWNIGEEQGPGIEPMMTDQQRIDAAHYISSIDPYNHHIVSHSRPDENSQNAVYTPLLGSASQLTGASLQCTDNDIVHHDVLRWIRASDDAGKKWVVCNDEQGPYPAGVTIDEDYVGSIPSNNQHNDNRDEIRKKVLYGTMLAGGAGVEYYYGYQTGCTDLNCQDHRSRASKWKDARIAKHFFDEYFQEFLPNVTSMDHLTEIAGDFVLSANDEAFLVYMPEGGTTAIELPEQIEWLVQWYNPRALGGMSSTEILRETLSAPDTQDWLALITKTGVEMGNLAPNIRFVTPEPQTKYSLASDIGVEAETSDLDGEVVKVTLFVNGDSVRSALHSPYRWGASSQEFNDIDLKNLTDGKHVLQLIAYDNLGSEASVTRVIELKKECPIEGCPRFPRNGESATIPGIIQAEDFDLGEAGDTYFDSDLGNNGESYGGRPGENVDTGGGPNGLTVGWTEAGEWLEYSVISMRSGYFNISFDMSSGNSAGARLSVFVDGFKVVDGFQTTTTGGWESYQAFEPAERFYIGEGEHILRLEFESGGSNLDQFTVSYLGEETLLIDQQNEVLLYPNPVGRNLYISCPQLAHHVVLRNISGQQITTTSLSGNIVDVDGLSPGIYMLHVNFTDGHSLNYKFMKK